jgi:hypothetical protein
VFTPSPAPLRGKTYPLSTILEGITLYDLGYPLPEVVAKLKSRYGHTVAPSSLSAWIAEHKELTTYRRLRAQGRRLFPLGGVRGGSMGRGGEKDTAISAVIRLDRRGVERRREEKRQLVLPVNQLPFGFPAA